MICEFSEGPPGISGPAPGLNVAYAQGLIPDQTDPKITRATRQNRNDSFFRSKSRKNDMWPANSADGPHLVSKLLYLGNRLFGQTLDNGRKAFHFRTVPLGNRFVIVPARSLQSRKLRTGIRWRGSKIQCATL